MPKKRPTKLTDVYPKLKKDKDGWWICRYCGRRINQGRRYRAWCSGDCDQNAKERTYSSWARSALEGRENGVCQECGLDTTELHHELRLLQSAVKWDKKLSEQAKSLHMNVLRTIVMSMKKCGFNADPRWGTWTTLWHMDHITEHASGGTLEPENLQTLCVPCHKKKTKKYVGKR